MRYFLLLSFLLSSCTSLEFKHTTKKHNCSDKKLNAPLDLKNRRGVSSLSNQKISLDAHIHYINKDSFEDIETHLSKYKISNAFIIATTYPANSPGNIRVSPREDYYESRVFSPESRFESIDVVSTYISNKKNIFGLCGISFQWEDLKDVADYCLSKKNMKGFKVHFGQEGDIDLSQNINSLMSNYKRPLIILIHPYINREMKTVLSEKEIQLCSSKGISRRNCNFITESDSAISENDNIVKNVLNLAEKNPNKIFVIAHVFENLFGSKALLRRLENTEIPENLFFDFAARSPEVTYNAEVARYEFDLWRKIGLDRIVFGSDFVTGLNEFEDSFYMESMLSTNLLSESDKHSLFQTSGVKILELFKKYESSKKH